jgi:tetratricopeptide (TPR) repeat protein
LGPEVAEAHASRGLALSLSKRYQEAEREFNTATRLNPKLFEAHYFFGRALFQQGKHKEAVAHYEQALRVRPEDYQTPILQSFAYAGLGRKADAEAAIRRGLQLAEKHLELNPNDARALYLGANALVQLGEREKGLEWAGRALALNPNDPGVLYNLACVHALVGDIDGALAHLDKAIRNGFGHREWLEHDSDLDSLRADSRFEVLLKKL